jgi:pimeloyl-ACP methyl ester carboxylesterase
MPDIDTGQRGTGTVHVIKLQLDVNHDGEMDLSFGGPDNTCKERPLVFWVNNDRDEAATGSKPDRDLSSQAEFGEDRAQPDFIGGRIRCQRNLEDFARLWMCGLPPLPSASGYSITLSMNAHAGSPSINLYRSHDPNGGPLYLSDTTTAAAQFTKLQVGSLVVFDYSHRLSVISPGTQYIVPVSTDGTPQFTRFLFEGSGTGSAELVLTISHGTNVLARHSTWLELRDIKDLYERVDIRNVSSAPPNSRLSTFNEANNVPVASTEAQQVIVFVHGWRMPEFEYRSFSESMFKRLYWQGYQGRFASLRWPTHSEDTSGVVGQFATYNPSEFRAFQSGRGASAYFTHLRQRFPEYTIGVCAHSMGNIVMAEALRTQRIAALQDIDTYVLMQAASPAHCYDTLLPNYARFVNKEATTPTPDSYRGYPGAIDTAVRNNIINFFNTNDFALATGVIPNTLKEVHWEANETDYKPDTGYSWNGTVASTGGYTVTDPQELLAFVARPRSKAVGALPGVGGVIQTMGEVDLKGSFGFDTDRSEHSAQFNWNIQRLEGFYQELITKMQIATP